MTITREDLKAKIDRGDDFILVETLPAESYHLGHLPGAINLPPSEVAKRAYQVLPNLNADIVVYCARPS
jgi:rhodanese-related sulfurtransferase